MAPQGAADLGFVDAGNVLGAKSQAQGEIKTYTEIQNEGYGNPQTSQREFPPAESGQAK